MRKQKNRITPAHESIAKFSVEDFIAIMDKIISTENPLKPSSVKGRKRHWYNLIMENNLECPVSKKKVAYCSFDILRHANPKVAPSYHFNFYAEDGKMFTIDHKIPLSRGGTNEFSNIQPMIDEINWEKKDQLIYT